MKQLEQIIEGSMDERKSVSVRKYPKSYLQLHSVKAYKNLYEHVKMQPIVSRKPQPLSASEREELEKFYRGFKDVKFSSLNLVTDLIEEDSQFKD